MIRARNIVSAALATLVVALLTVVPPTAYAATPATAPMEIKIWVNEKGFLDERGKPYGPKHPLKIAKGTRVALTFVFGESVQSLAIGDTHQVAIMAEDGWRVESGKIWFLNRQTSLDFLAGEDGRSLYRVACILDCLGMEHLTNLVINVV